MNFQFFLSFNSARPSLCLCVCLCVCLSLFPAAEEEGNGGGGGGRGGGEEVVRNGEWSKVCEKESAETRQRFLLPIPARSIHSLFKMD